MNRNKIVLLLILPLMFSSCLSIKKFKGDDLNVRNTLRDTTVAKADTLENFSWQDIFVDEPLRRLISEGIEKNSDIKMAAENVIQSQAYLKASNWSYVPSVSASVTSGYSTMSTPEQQVFVGGNISWEPDIWGKITANKRAALNSIDRDIASFRSVQSQVVSQIASLYYQLMALDEQLSLMRDFIALSEQTVKTMEVMRDNGRGNSASVEQAQAQLFSARSSLPQIESSIYSTECALSIMLGREAGSIERSNVYVGCNDSFIERGFPFYMVSNRPDVKSAEYELVRAFNLTQASKASMYPSVRFSLDIGAAGSSMYNFYNPAVLAANFLGSLTAPLINGKALRTQHRVNQSRYRQYVVQFDAALRQAGADVSQALYGYSSYTKQLQYRVLEVESSRKAVDYTKQLLFNGGATYLEVLSAQSSYLSSSLNLIDDRLQKENTFVTLYKSLGGGWQ